MKADIKGIISSMNISESNFLLPIFEAVVNGVQSIHEKKVFDPKHSGLIEVIIRRDKSQGDLNEGDKEQEANYPISGIIITDNGIGFTDANLKSFNTAHSTKKVRIGGKGLGRFAILSIFKDASIKSNYEHGGECFERTIPFNTEYTESKVDTVKIDQYIQSGTSIALQNIHDKFIKASAKYTQESIAEEILKHCLLYFINDNQPKIIIKEDNCADINLSTLFDPRDYLINSYLNRKIKGSEFNFYLVKEFSLNYSFYSYTANDRTVETKRIHTVLPVFKSKLEHKGDEFYVGVYITSDFLNERVHNNRLDVRFDKENKDSPEKNFNTITESEVASEIISILNEEFSDVINKREESNKEKVNEYLRGDGIGYRWLKIDNDFLQTIPDDANDKKLDDLFHDLEYKTKRDLSKKREKLLARDYSNKPEYRELLNEVLDSIGNENESRLAQYVSHRKTVLFLLDKYLQWQDEQKRYEEESALHNLFFAMGGTEKTVDHFKHNLWLIDERLAYFNFIRSDIALKYQEIVETDSLKEPDVTLYNTSYKYGDSTSGEDIKTIVFIEFKRPHRNNLSYGDYQKQMMEQVKGVDKGIEDYRGAYMNVSQHKTIHYYFICDVKDFHNIEYDAKEYGGFNKSPYGTLIRFSNNRIEEIMTYQQVKTSAIKRNTSFFKQLGID